MSAVNWTKSGTFGFAANGAIIRRDSRGMFLVFDESDRLVGEFATVAEAERAVA